MFNNLSSYNKDKESDGRFILHNEIITKEISFSFAVILLQSYINIHEHALVYQNMYVSA